MRAPRSDIRPVLLLLAALLAIPACRREAPPAPAQELEASSLPAIKVTQRSRLLLTYAAADGTFSSVTGIKEVPADHRGWVRVVDLALKPEERKDHELVYVADLRSTKKDGSYPYVVMSREAFESAALGRATAGATEPPAKGSASKGPAQVILYATIWCPACRTAREYMTREGIPFVEKDIEKDAAAARELLDKARAAGISASGVPVLDVKGTLMQGFDPKRLRALLGPRPQSKRQQRTHGDRA